MASVASSPNTFYHTISQFNNSDFETPYDFTGSEPIPSIFSQAPFQPFHSQVTIEPSSPPSFHNDENPTYSLLTGDPSDHSSPVDTELENEPNNFKTLQQQLQHANTLTFHNLSQTMTSSESSNPASTTEETRALRVFKRKLPNTPCPSNPRTAQTFSTHPLHTNTKKFLQVCLLFFPQYTYYHSNPKDDQPNYVNKNAILPTLS